MTILERRRPLPSAFGRLRGHLALLALFAAVAIAATLPPARAESAPPASTTKPGPPSAKPAHVVTESAQTTKQTAVKAKPKPRVAPKSAKPSPPATKSSAASTAKPAPDSPAKATQVMDFDTDQVEGQRMEPGFELIEAAPRRARQPSMVTYPPKPEDSVVKQD